MSEAGARWAFDDTGPAPEGSGFRIRTITLGLPFRGLDDAAALDRAATFLHEARRRFEDAGHAVQTLRVAMPPLPALIGERGHARAIPALAKLEAAASERGVLLGLGPLAVSDATGTDIAAFACDLAVATGTLCFSLPVADKRQGASPARVAAAGAIIARIARATPGGAGNFRFAATACCGPGIPFFPAAWHEGAAAFALGIEGPPLLAAAIADVDHADVPGRIASALEAALAPVAEIAGSLAAARGIAFCGIDSSPAPLLDASIGVVIERLSGTPFGSAGTLAACAAITGGLQRLSLATCGFSGLMLPLLEDPVLARRAAEGRFGVNELLLYSSVCGTGLDTVPLAGDTPPAAIAALIGDLAALALRYDKPLAARLLPVPGKAAGERVAFDIPFLTDSVALAIP
ncbi:MAG: DUF711 family protein [Rhodothalassiaceae bacterium]